MRVAFAMLAGATVFLAILPASANPPATGILTIRVTSLRSSNGQVGCMTLTTPPKGFPTDSSAAISDGGAPSPAR